MDRITASAFVACASEAKRAKEIIDKLYFAMEAYDYEASDPKFREHMESAKEEISAAQDYMRGALEILKRW